jgi:hypothetical protein
MPRRRKFDSPPAPPATLPPPLDAGDPERISLDATDWHMYCDRLQDADAPEEEWQRAQRIAASLDQDSNLVLIAGCEAEHLYDHYLRVGENWFIGADGTHLWNYPLVWWRPAWVLAGFRRYPTTSEDRKPRKLITLNTGTPWGVPNPAFPTVRQGSEFPKLILAFFNAHSQVKMPLRYQ